jgi:hypothetical protein
VAIKILLPVKPASLINNFNVNGCTKLLPANVIVWLQWLVPAEHDKGATLAL